MMKHQLYDALRCFPACLAREVALLDAGIATENLCVGGLRWSCFL